MRRLLALALVLLSQLATPVLAQETVTYEVVEETVADAPGGGSDRFVGAQSVAIPQGIAQFGPFRVIDGTTAVLVDATDERSPAQFAAMLAAFPRIGTLEMLECPGTLDDGANLRLGRMIRAKGLVTWVPAGGSVRSGGVELFLAGVKRVADPGSEFAVHAWEDEDGRQPGDFAADAPANRAYLDYYREMGMTSIEAKAFYDMTNSVPNEDAKWLNAAQMGQWVRLDQRGEIRPGSRVAVLDSATPLR